MLDMILSRFDTPDHVSVVDWGRFETVTLGGVTIGRATYEPRRKWSADIGPPIGHKYCPVEHVGIVLLGRAAAAFAEGRMTELRGTNLFHLPAEPHES